ncbi:J domain-containing protein [Shewanella sp. MEBiC00475]|uniref:J domain-containing protein n=1 Tax=Shewanella sp. MEBiC00475 TaxID=2575361 RepID=UPI0020C7649A|nr:J domain-containing protein [Shewanella sp. MEBiC00475]
MTLMTIIDDSELNNSSKQRQKLDKLWQDVEKRQTRNQRYQAKVDDFFELFKPLIESKEHVVCAATEQWVRHLLSFVPRKTIKGEYRITLYEWIEEELNILEANPFNPVSTDELRDLFASSMIDFQSNIPKQAITADDLDNFREELFDMFGEDIPLSNDELTHLIHNPEAFQAYIQEMLDQRHKAEEQDELEDEFEWDEPDWNNMNDEFSFNQRSPEPAMSLALFENKAMTKLYRQLANQFHPDKELDPAKKALKKVLMQQLSQAKKDKDALALMMMAQEHLPEYKLIADGDMMKRIEAALRGKLALLNEEHQMLQHGDDIKTEIWRRFGNGSKASRAKTLAEYGDLLLIEAEALFAKVSHVTTVKTMKVELAERLEQQQFSGMIDFDMFEGFMD